MGVLAGPDQRVDGYVPAADLLGRKGHRRKPADTTSRRSPVLPEPAGRQPASTTSGPMPQ